MPFLDPTFSPRPGYTVALCHFHTKKIHIFNYGIRTKNARFLITLSTTYLVEFNTAQTKPDSKSGSQSCKKLGKEIFRHFSFTIFEGKKSWQLLNNSLFYAHTHIQCK